MGSLWSPEPLVPPPRFHLVRYHGVLAPAAKWRSEIVPAPIEDATDMARAHEPGTGASSPTTATVNLVGAQHGVLEFRAFDVDNNAFMFDDGDSSATDWELDGVKTFPDREI